ncbi:hypothetical protein STSP2_00651 [Anaerohalosphaera lusitana]|uniref:Uncharacterized protein n=1 Tax=Anaerohalosphaera lusitana TaxID=1936003 RepID=A0A1U9NHV2_9BACT|nr:hypothetical protein STSP2_00651 [Anaerohalosphaera lusitana]
MERDRKAAEERFNEGVEFCNKGRYEECLNAFEEAIRLEPTNSVL